MTVADSAVYYDPFDIGIDDDPYPVWKRLRDEQPLYYNAKHDFYAYSRFEDVEQAITDWETYSSSKGTLLELIKSDFPIPPGSIIFEDPPGHDLHRNLLRRIFTPRAISALEPKIREFTVNALDPLVGSDGFDFIADLGAQMPMRTIGFLLGIPEGDQVAIRERIDDGLKLTDEGLPNMADRLEKSTNPGKIFGDYIDWRMKNPSDDLMTELLQAEYDDENGVRKKLSRDEVLGYVQLLASAGNETTTRLIGWIGKLLADNPDQRAELVADPSLIPGAVEETLRYEPPSPVQSRYVTKDVELYGQVVPAGSAVVLINGSANRDERVFPDPDRYDIHRAVDRHLSFGLGIHFCLGAALARLEARVALEEVLKRFPTWEVDWANAHRAHTSTVRGWEKLPVFTR